MVKVVDKGERVCSITLDGTESSITFQEAYKYFAVQNNSDTDINISLKRGFSSTDDGVMTVVAGSSVLFPHMRSNVNQFFVKGTGKIQVCATNEPINPFVNAPAKSSGGGTEGDYYTKAQSDAKYVQASSLADVATSGSYSDLKGTPEKLPADGGNADTVGGHTVGCDVPENAVFTPPDLSGYALLTDVIPYRMGMDFGMCTTAAATISKVVTTLNKVAPLKGAVFTIKFTNSVPAKSRLSVNGLTGYLYYKGSSISADIINAGDVVTFMYYESRELNIFEVLSIENGGNAKTVNGFTVGCNVPADAVFTPPDLSGYASKELYGDTTINVGRKAGSTVGEYSIAEGLNTIASGGGSHAEGGSTEATGDVSHAEGGGSSRASGYASHAEGVSTRASGYASHAEGTNNDAIGSWSHTEGYGTIANNESEHASGQFNVSNEDTLFSVGDGTDFDNRHNAFEITKTGGKLHDKDIATTDLIPTIPTSLPANGGNADMVDGVHAWNMHTLAAGGGSHGSGRHLMYCKYNVLGNGKFYIGVTDGYDRAVAVNFAENADTVDDMHIHCVNDGVSGTSWFAVFATTNDIRAVDPARAYVGSSGGVTCSLIGTASGCQYSTILAWANAQTTSTFASIVAATGFPSDAPYQQEALLQVQVDYYHQRKIVTWTRYLGEQAPQIRQRAIFGEAWNDNDWRVVCG